MTSQDCSYIRYLKHIDSLASVNRDEEFVDYEESNETLWQRELIELFKIMRKVTTQSKNTDSSEMKKFSEFLESVNQEEIFSYLSSYPPTLKITSFDQVLICLLLKWLSLTLKQHNKLLFEYKKQCSGISSCKPEFPIAEIFSKNKCLCDWVLAALILLDETVAHLEDVAYNLQVIRRCCRWRRLTYENEANQIYINELKCLECIIESFFNQK